MVTDVSRNRPRLPKWSQIAPELDNCGLLLGNGASIAVWERFRYSSLYATAVELGHTGPGGLTQAEEKIFADFQTENFEEVLFSLYRSTMVCDALGIASDPILDSYENIRSALIAAVH